LIEGGVKLPDPPMPHHRLSWMTCLHFTVANDVYSLAQGDRYKYENGEILTDWVCCYNKTLSRELRPDLVFSEGVLGMIESKLSLPEPYREPVYWKLTSNGDITNCVTDKADNGYGHELVSTEFWNNVRPYNVGVIREEYIDFDSCGAVLDSYFLSRIERKLTLPLPPRSSIRHLEWIAKGELDFDPFWDWVIEYNCDLYHPEPRVNEFRNTNSDVVNLMIDLREPLPYPPCYVLNWTKGNNEDVARGICHGREMLAYKSTRQDYFTDRRMMKERMRYKANRDKILKENKRVLTHIVGDEERAEDIAHGIEDPIMLPVYYS